jgi:hypothetical protein
MGAAEPQTPGPDVEQLVHALVDGKLAEYLLNTDTANSIIKEIAEESGVPRGAVRIAFKLLAPMLVSRAQAGVGWFGRRLLANNRELIAKLPGYSLIAEKLLALRARLDADITRREQLNAILAGERPPSDIEHAKGLSQELRVGLLQLGRIEELRVHIDDRFDQILERLNPQPPLDPKLLERNAANRLRFEARRVRFLGRTAELEQLRAFLRAESPFSWWLMIGSGGQGKSRLAQELCLRAGTAWRAGFLRWETSFNAWDDWQPESGTLIVLDYAVAWTEEVRRIIARLSTREHTNPLEAPVRLLLIERDSPEPWLNKLVGTGGESYVIEQSQFAPEPLVLGPMPQDDLWESISSILHEAGKPLPDRAETLHVLREMDPKGRPLFAAFAADAIADHGDIRAWDRQRLLRDVLIRERERHWRPAGITEAYENLLCLATMTTGHLRLAALRHLPPTLDLPSIEHFRPEQYEFMVGTSIGSPETPDLLPALQPNLLGEFFVLERLASPNAWTHNPAARLRDALWHLSPETAEAYGGFLARTIDDFFDHPTLSILLDLSLDLEYQRFFWSTLSMIMTFRYGELEQFDKCAELLKRLTDVSHRFREEPFLLRNLARVLRNLIGYYKQARRYQEAEEAFISLEEALRGREMDPELMQTYGESCVNIIDSCGLAGDAKKAARYHSLLVTFAEENADNISTQILLAKGTYNAIGAMARQNREENLDRNLALLEGLHARFPDEQDVLTSLHNAALAMVIVRGNKGDLQGSAAWLRRAVDLEAKYSGGSDRAIDIEKRSEPVIEGLWRTGDPSQAMILRRSVRAMLVRRGLERPN